MLAGYSVTRHVESLYICQPIMNAMLMACDSIPRVTASVCSNSPALRLVQSLTRMTYMASGHMAHLKHRFRYADQGICCFADL